MFKMWIVQKQDRIELSEWGKGNLIEYYDD